MCIYWYLIYIFKVIHMQYRIQYYSNGSIKFATTNSETISNSVCEINRIGEFINMYKSLSFLTYAFCRDNIHLRICLMYQY